MTVITQSYNADAIKQIIRDNKNNFRSPPSSRSKKSLFTLQDQLDDLRQELIQFTVSNSLSITSALDLGERYQDHLDDFRAEFEEEGATFEIRNDLVKDAFAAGVLQRNKKEDERRIRAAEAIIADTRLYLSVRPTMTYEELLKSTMFQRNLRSAHVSTPICEQLLRDALAQKPFIYPDEAEAEPDEKKESYLDAVENGTIGVINPVEKPTAIKRVPEPQETTFPEERPEIPGAAVVAPETVEDCSRAEEKAQSSLTEAPLSYDVDMRTGEILTPQKPKRITRATQRAMSMKERVLQAITTATVITPNHWYSIQDVMSYFPHDSIPRATMHAYLEDLRHAGSLLRCTEYQRLKNGKSTKRYRYSLSDTTTF